MTDSGLNNILRENILPYIKHDVWFQDAAFERAVWELTELRERMDRFDEGRLTIVKELVRLLSHYPELLANSRGNNRSHALRQLAVVTRNLQKRMLLCYKSFLRNSYRRYCCTETEFLVEEEAARGLRKALVDRFESSIEPDIKKTLNIMRAFIDRLEKENYE
jgi:hypothetical protein